jgi:hypothetical protein
MRRCRASIAQDQDNDIARSIGERSHPGPLDCFALARDDVEIFLEIFSEIFFLWSPSGDLPCLKAGARAAGLVLFAQHRKSLQKKAAGADARIG